MSELPRRKLIGLKNELLLALMPTLTNQRLLFASLASSAFLIYLDPGHAVNKVCTLVTAQMGAAVIGLLIFLLLGPGYLSGGLAMVLAIMAMVMFDAMHPPAVSTALSFGLRAGDESNLVLFALAVGITAVLVGLQRAALWLLRRSKRRDEGHAHEPASRH
jgi:CBS-domain-containing membrane protein